MPPRLPQPESLGKICKTLATTDDFYTSGIFTYLSRTASGLPDDRHAKAKKLVDWLKARKLKARKGYNGYSLRNAVETEQAKVWTAEEGASVTAWQQEIQQTYEDAELRKLHAKVPALV